MSELTEDLRREAGQIRDAVAIIEAGRVACSNSGLAMHYRRGRLFRAAADRIEELERELARTRRQWVDGADPMCEDVCLDVCRGPCGVGGDR